MLRGDRLVLSGVSFRVAPGGVLLLRGPNGVGKSTLLRALAGLCAPFSGILRWNGADIAAEPAAHAARIAFLGHTDALKPGLTLAENLGLAAVLGGARNRGNAVDAALDRLGLLPFAALPGRLLSAGQKRRAALARCLLLRAPLWLLDEPTLGLDDASVSALGGIFAEHVAAGGAIVAATHVPLPLPGAAVLEFAG